jgi:hypothetical protein
MKAAILLLVACAAQQATPANETLAFRFGSRGNAIPSYTLTIHGDGTALYQVSYPPEIPKYSPYAATMKALPNTELTLNVMLSPATTARIFDSVRDGGLREDCVSHAKNLADMGTKSLSYTSSARTVTCTYNYTDDKTIYALTNTLQAIAFTLDEGRKLEKQHRYDRLGLDSETETLINAVKQGTALELGTIAPTLRSLVDDPQVLERVRARAAKLLAQAGPNP